MRRRTVLKGIGATTGAAAVGGVAAPGAAASPAVRAGGDRLPQALTFDQDIYTVRTDTLTDANGESVQVTYRFYAPITYVTRPVDATHQSLVISVPVAIDGKKVDASRAPIVFANWVGGYFPVSVAAATGVGEGVMEMPGGQVLVNNGNDTNLPKLALAAGYVVVEPGARGRTLVDDGGVHYGTAPAVIVDLKAAVRYLRANKGRVPGDTDRIISTGTSAGGAMSALLGASGGSHLYDTHLTELGAADAGDGVFATAAWCPIADLEHADMAYEWCWGTTKLARTGALVDQTLSKELSALFADYQASLRIDGLHGYGRLTARNYDDYLLKTYLWPAATTYLAGLSATARATYLAANPTIRWDGKQASFTWDEYLAHMGGRNKGVPSFDAFDASTGENNLFGNGTVSARHFTQYGLDHDTTGLGTKHLDKDIPGTLDLMNPMHFIQQRNAGRSRYWWIRLGTSDPHTSLTISSNIAASLGQLGDSVNTAMYWDAGHATNRDPAAFLSWIAGITGYHAPGGSRG
ncbi:subtype B tannase [Streptomyces justiciae]|uniref:Subtype B tannase n=1 Tax=Streptomyces justiciae TaxID=2780140 RepID=A0ABU3M7X4_9ACTN|nr:subtype B tannase [Streptomyces justiciae]MDT7847540.1 subtype B tannase [Streptomyces justiciae]